jgi:hypothetical protein
MRYESGGGKGRRGGGVEGRETRVMFFSEWRVEGRSERSVPTRRQRRKPGDNSVSEQTEQKSDTDMQTTSRH